MSNLGQQEHQEQWSVMTLWRNHLCLTELDVISQATL